MINSIKKVGIFFCFFVLVFCLADLVLAEKLALQIGKLQYDKVDFKIVIYDEKNNKIDGDVEYVIKDYYDDLVGNGKASSGELIEFRLPKNPSQGAWKIVANYKVQTITELFNVGDLERVDIKLEDDNLIIENTGNVVFDNDVIITIGDVSKVEKFYIGVGEVRKFKLTAPSGYYTVKVDDGTRNERVVFSDVSLTGNVIGLENVYGGNLFKKYVLVWVFLITVFVAFFVVSFVARKKGFAKKRKK